jgi:hypothetical protein
MVWIEPNRAIEIAESLIAPPQPKHYLARLVVSLGRALIQLQGSLDMMLGDPQLAEIHGDVGHHSVQSVILGAQPQSGAKVGHRVAIALRPQAVKAPSSLVCPGCCSKRPQASGR